MTNRPVAIAASSVSVLSSKKEVILTRVDLCEERQNSKRVEWGVGGDTTRQEEPRGETLCYVGRSCESSGP